MSGTAQRVPNRTLITLSVMLGNLMQALDATIANVSLPYMQGTPVGQRRRDHLGADVLRDRRRHHDRARRLDGACGSAARTCTSPACAASPRIDAVRGGARR